MKLKELAELLNAQFIGNGNLNVKGIADFEKSKEGELVFIFNQKDKKSKLFGVNKKSILVTKQRIEAWENQILCENPRLIFLKIVELFYKKSENTWQIAQDVIVGKNSQISPKAWIKEKVYIGEDVKIDEGCIIYPFVYIGDKVQLGKDCIIYPHVSIYSNVKIGSRVIIHANSVIGGDGFGYIRHDNENKKIPHIGGVIIGDDVEIGANVCIDRGTIGNTQIGSGTKIDNLVHIGHNVKIKERCLIVAQVGISGSVEIGNDVILAGQVGILEHVKIGNRVKVGAKSGVTKNIKDDMQVSGFPAKEHIKNLRSMIIFEKLPEILKQIKKS